VDGPRGSIEDDPDAHPNPNIWAAGDVTAATESSYYGGLIVPKVSAAPKCRGLVGNTQLRKRIHALRVVFLIAGGPVSGL